MTIYTPNLCHSNENIFSIKAGRYLCRMVTTINIIYNLNIYWNKCEKKILSNIRVWIEKGRKWIT